ncbi:MAG: hypothetical protein Q8Q60_01270 [Candidatus Chromulinivorax sp.]|nr:hypothetical protein [Candidatus Chromulinivorax sp.]
MKSKCFVLLSLLLNFFGMVFASEQETLPLKLVIAQATSEMYAINRFQPTSPKSATKYDAIIAKLDSVIRDKNYSDINQDIVTEIDLDNCCNIITAPLIAIISVAMFDFEHDMIHSYSRKSCEKRIAYAQELLEKKNK